MPPKLVFSCSSLMTGMISGNSSQALDERILDDLAEAPGEGEKAGGRQILVAEEDDVVVEPGAADGANGVVVHLRAQVDAVNLRSDGAGDGAYLYSAFCHDLAVPSL